MVPGLMTPMSPKDAEAWLGGWAMRLLSALAEADQMRQFAETHFNDQGRAAGTLVRGMDKVGKPIAWTERELNAVVESYALCGEVLGSIAKVGPDGQSVLQKVQSIARPMMGPQNGGQ